MHDTCISKWSKGGRYYLSSLPSPWGNGDTGCLVRSCVLGMVLDKPLSKKPYICTTVHTVKGCLAVASPPSSPLLGLPPPPGCQEIRQTQEELVENLSQHSSVCGRGHRQGSVLWLIGRRSRSSAASECVRVQTPQSSAASRWSASRCTQVDAYTRWVHRLFVASCSSVCPADHF